MWHLFGESSSHVVPSATGMGPSNIGLKQLTVYCRIESKLFCLWQEYSKFELLGPARPSTIISQCQNQSSGKGSHLHLRVFLYPSLRFVLVVFSIVLDTSSNRRTSHYDREPSQRAAYERVILIQIIIKFMNVLRHFVSSLQ